MSDWHVFDGAQPTLIPARPACYVVYLDGVLSYIGQSVNLNRRLNAHAISAARHLPGIGTCWGRFGSVTIKAHFGRRYGDWAMRELRLIRRLRPPLNCRGGPRKSMAAWA